MTYIDLFIRDKILHSLQIENPNLSQEILLHTMIEDSHKQYLLHMDIDHKIQYLSKKYKQRFYALNDHTLQIL